MGGNCIIWSFMLQTLQDFVRAIKWRRMFWASVQHIWELGVMFVFMVL